MRAACVGVAGFLAMSGELVVAEDSGAATSLEEIVVTAERRPQLIQEVPLSLVAFTGEQLNQARVMNLPDLDLLVPGLSLPVSSSVDNLRLNIRGVGSIGDAAVASSVATYIDEEYIARPGALLNTFVDVERVEVLRGPQGVLYGRNATVGVINLRSRNPVMNETDAWMQAAVGTDEYREVQAVGNAAMGSKVAGRLALSYRERDGYGRNTFEGEDPEFGAVEDTVVRAKLGFQPSENFSGVVKAEYSKLDYGGSVIEVLSSTVTPANLATLTFLSGGQAPDVEDTYDYRVRQRHFDNNEITQSGLGLDLAYDFSSGHTFQSITTYRDWEYETARDPVRLPLSVNDQIFNKQTDTWSQEFRLLSPSEETFEYVVGVYYYDEDFKSPETRDLGPDFCGTIVSQLELVGQVPAGTAAACTATPQDDAVVAEFSQTVESLAVYGQGTLQFNEQWSATAGARWTDDDLQGYYGSTTSNPVVAALAIASEPGRELEYTGDKTTWLASLQFSPTDDYLFYARYNTGYKSGGFNSDVPSTEPLTDDQRVFGPEDAKNIQVGGNTAWLDKRLFVNASVFRSEIDGFQDRAFDGTGFVTTNAGTLDVAGVEFELRARPVEPLYLSLGSVYLDSEFDSYPNAPNLPGLPGVQDLSGERNHFSPEWQWTAIGQWADAIPNTAMAWFTQAEWSYVDDQNIGATTDQNPQSVQDAYAVWNLRAGFGAADKRWEVMAYVENVGDERYCQVIFEQPFAAGLGVRDGEGNSLYRCVLGEPRTGGVRFTFRL